MTDAQPTPCPKCGGVRGRYGAKRQPYCRPCRAKLRREWVKSNWEKAKQQNLGSVRRHPKRRLFLYKKGNAKRKGIPFSIRYEDIVWPEFCPALGTRLDYSAGRQGHQLRDPRIVPSFDRLDNSKGYEPGNVVVISLAANSIKNEYTADEVLAVAAWLARHQ